MAADAIAAARDFLPIWAVWSPLASFATTAILSALLSAAAVAYSNRPLRRLGADAHWTERARLVWPVRRAIALACLLGLIAAAPLTIGGPLHRPGPLTRWIIGPATAVVAALAVAFVFENRMIRRLPPLTRWLSAAAYALLVAPAYWTAGAFAIWAAQERLSLRWSVAAGVIVVALALGAAPWVAAAARLGRALPSRALASLARVQQGVGGPPARLVVLPISNANAFAFHLTRTIGVTQGLLDHVRDQDLDALIAHELGHLREPLGVVALRTAVATVVPVALVVLPWVLQFRSTWAWLALWLFVVAVLLLYRRLQRALEQRADAAGRAVSPSYAAALETVYRTNSTPAVLGRAATHPDLYDRMVTAGVTPAWPRPQPPPSFVPLAMVLLAIASLAFSGAWFVRSAIAERSGDDRFGLTLRVAVDGRAFDTGRLAYWHLQNHDESAALALFRAAEAMDANDATWSAWVATVLAYQGRCAEASEASSRALARDPVSAHARAAMDLVGTCAPSGQ